jgi:hypothetical protein
MAWLGGSLLVVEIMQELHAARLSDAPNDCESDKSSNDDDYDDEFVPSASQKCRKRAWLEVTNADVNIDDDNVDDGWIKNDI